MTAIDSSTIRQDNYTELKVASILGIDAERALKGTLRVELERNRMVVKWESFVVPTEEQRDEILKVLATTYTRSPR